MFTSNMKLIKLNNIKWMLCILIFGTNFAFSLHFQQAFSLPCVWPSLVDVPSWTLQTMYPITRFAHYLQVPELQWFIQLERSTWQQRWCWFSNENYFPIINRFFVKFALNQITDSVAYRVHTKCNIHSTQINVFFEINSTELLHSRKGVHR